MLCIPLEIWRHVKASKNKTKQESEAWRVEWLKSPLEDTTSRAAVTQKKDAWLNVQSF